MAKNNFSREYLFNICEMQHHSVQVTFIPNTPSYNANGGYIIVQKILDEDGSLLMNQLSKPVSNTFGAVKCQILNPDDVANYVDAEFNTEDIYEIAHVKG